MCYLSELFIILNDRLIFLYFLHFKAESTLNWFPREMYKMRFCRPWRKWMLYTRWRPVTRSITSREFYFRFSGGTGFPGTLSISTTPSRHKHWPFSCERLPLISVPWHNREDCAVKSCFLVSIVPLDQALGHQLPLSSCHVTQIDFRNLLTVWRHQICTYRPRM